MNKRRRTSSVASRGTEDDGDDTPPEPTKRRKKLDPSDLCQQLYEILRNQKKEDGSLLCDAFIRVPKRRQEPGYYEVVSNPIDLLKVQQKLKTDEYRDMDDLAADIQLMVNNAKAFYMRTSPEYKDATELWELCLNTKNRIMEEYEEPEPKGKLILKVGRLSRTDSQPFEDNVELQAFFLRTRDEVTRAGDLLHSPALNYTLLDLSAQVAELKRIKQQQELNLPNEEESCDGNETKDSETNTDTNNTDNGGSMSFNQEVYRAGDFTYIEPTERGMEYSVVLIERLWTNADGQQMLYGNLFYRPSETYHVASRKFLDKELFKSDAHVAVPLAKVAGRCCVLSVKDYFRMQPEGFLEKDVYVCESRYSTKARAFKKIKVWNFDPDHLTLVPREKPLEPKRVISVYKERLEKHKEEIAELEEGEKLMEKERPVSN